MSLSSISPAHTVISLVNTVNPIAAPSASAFIQGVLDFDVVGLMASACFIGATVLEKQRAQAGDSDPAMFHLTKLGIPKSPYPFYKQAPGSATCGYATLLTLLKGQAQNGIGAANSVAEDRKSLEGRPETALKPGQEADALSARELALGYNSSLSDLKRLGKGDNLYFFPRPPDAAHVADPAAHLYAPQTLRGSSEGVLEQAREKPDTFYVHNSDGHSDPSQHVKSFAVLTSRHKNSEYDNPHWVSIVRHDDERWYCHDSAGDAPEEVAAKEKSPVEALEAYLHKKTQQLGAEYALHAEVLVPNLSIPTKRL